MGDGSWPESIGIVGAGAMGSAFAGGLARRAANARFLVTDVLPVNATALAAEIEGAAVALDQAAGCDLVCIAVKPPDADAALASLSAHLDPSSVVLSVVAGVTLARMRERIASASLVRTMPNLAVRHGTGIVAWAHEGLGVERRRDVGHLLRELGAAPELPESLFGAATALAGSGPGFAAYVAEGLEDGGVAAGLSRSQARDLVRAVLAGTASLLEGDGDPSALRERVSSPGGTTLAGLEVLDDAGVRDRLAAAVIAAARRADEL